MDLLYVFVGGLFTIVGAILGALISKYGLPFKKQSGITFNEGYAEEYEFLGRHFDGKTLKHNVETTLNGIQISASEKEVTFQANAVFRKDSKIISSGVFRGKGPLVNGIAYCQYSVVDLTGNKQWAGVCVFTIPLLKDKISGVWITEDVDQKGDLALGTITFVE